MDREIITARMYMEAVLPSVPLACEFYRELGDKFSKRTFTLQVLIDDGDGSDTFYFDIKEGVWTAYAQEKIDKPDIEFSFNSYKQFNSFFAGSGTSIPKIKGLLKVNLLKDTINLLTKFAKTFWDTAQSFDDNDQDFQVAVFVDAIPRMIKVLKRDALFEIVANFSVEENVCVKAKITNSNIDLSPILLSYAPIEGETKKELKEYSLIFANNQEFLDVMLGFDFSEESKAVNNQYPMDFMKFFVGLVNYHLRLYYREK